MQFCGCNDLLTRFAAAIRCLGSFCLRGLGQRDKSSRRGWWVRLLPVNSDVVQHSRREDHLRDEIQTQCFKKPTHFQTFCDSSTEALCRDGTMTLGTSFFFSDTGTFNVQLQSKDATHMSAVLSAAM